jgi:hypothetical protein
MAAFGRVDRSYPASLRQGGCDVGKGDATDNEKVRLDKLRFVPDARRSGGPAPAQQPLGLDSHSRLMLRDHSSY